MLLAIDIGNTRIKWGLHDGQQWLQHAFTSNGLPDLQQSLRAWPTRIVVSDVSSAQYASQLPNLFPDIPLQQLFASAMACGIRNHYHNPAQLGADRWAAVIGAHQLGARNSIIVNAGTALTVDALHQNDYLGGSITLGYQRMRQALANHTRLPESGTTALSLFPQDTEHALATGCLTALLGCVHHLQVALTSKSGQAADIWLAGGDAELLAPWLTSRHEPHLVLEGLRAIATEEHA